MKKGPLAPRARARWTQGANTSLRYAPPVWATVYTLACTYIKEIEGIPVPLFVNEGDVDAGLWRYDAVNGDIVYRAAWADLFSSGHWYYRQHRGPTEYVERTFRIELDTDLGTPGLVLRSLPNVQHGDWDPAFPTVNECTEVISWDLPWLPVGLATFRETSYAHLRSLGIDPDDLDPATWDYTGKP